MSCLPHSCCSLQFVLNHVSWQAAAYNDPMRATVVTAGDGTEALLSSCVPLRNTTTGCDTWQGPQKDAAHRAAQVMNSQTCMHTACRATSTHTMLLLHMCLITGTAE